MSEKIAESLRRLAEEIELALGSARAEEREACAGVLDEMAEEEHRHAGKAFGTDGERLAMLAHQTAMRGAAAIRARGGA